MQLLNSNFGKSNTCLRTACKNLHPADVEKVNINNVPNTSRGLPKSNLLLEDSNLEFAHSKHFYDLTGNLVSPMGNTSTLFLDLDRPLKKDAKIGATSNNDDAQSEKRLENQTLKTILSKHEDLCPLCLQVQTMKNASSKHQNNEELLKKNDIVLDDMLLDQSISQVYSIRRRDKEVIKKNKNIGITEVKNNPKHFNENNEELQNIGSPCIVAKIDSSICLKNSSEIKPIIKSRCSMFNKNNKVSTHTDCGNSPDLEMSPKPEKNRRSKHKLKKVFASSNHDQIKQHLVSDLYKEEMRWLKNKSDFNFKTTGYCYKVESLFFREQKNEGSEKKTFSGYVVDHGVSMSNMYTCPHTPKCKYISECQIKSEKKLSPKLVKSTCFRQSQMANNVASDFIFVRNVGCQNAVATKEDPEVNDIIFVRDVGCQLLQWPCATDTIKISRSRIDRDEHLGLNGGNAKRTIMVHTSSVNLDKKEFSCPAESNCREKDNRSDSSEDQQTNDTVFVKDVGCQRKQRNIKCKVIATASCSCCAQRSCRLIKFENAPDLAPDYDLKTEEDEDIKVEYLK